jgi:murein DD-endopeptidase MepM/ murein hydrolase activator NlpD
MRRESQWIVRVVVVSLLVLAASCSPVAEEDGSAALGVAGPAHWPISDSTAPDADEILEPYGPRWIGEYDFHAGIDIPADPGTDVHAVLPGTVINVAPWAETHPPGPGNNILIDHHDGRFTAYLHLSFYAVEEGDEVEAGDVIGQTGRTGATWNHLHLTFMRDLTGDSNDERKSHNPLELLAHTTPPAPEVDWGVAGDPADPEQPDDLVVVHLPIQQMTVSEVTLSNGTTSRSVSYAEIVARGKDARNEHLQPEQPRMYLNAANPTDGHFPLTLGPVPDDFDPDRVIIQDIDGGTYTAFEEPSQTVSFPAAADATVREAHPDMSYGSDPLSVTAAPTARREVNLRFDVSGLPAGAVVDNAVLTLTAAADGGTVDGPRLFRAATTSWTESTVTWKSRPATTGSAIADLGAIADGQTVQVPVTSVVTGNGTYGFVLVADSSDQLVVNSREASNGPALVVTYRTP